MDVADAHIANSMKLQLYIVAMILDDSAVLVSGEYTKALPLLSALVGTSRYCQAGVWLKHAECQYMLNDLEGAVMSYSKVLSLAPYHTDTRLLHSLSLSQI